MIPKYIDWGLKARQKPTYYLEDAFGAVALIFATFMAVLLAFML